MTQAMLAMRSHAPRARLAADRIPVPRPAAGEVLVKVLACGVCRTDLHVADGELPERRRPIVPGHEIVGRVVALGPGADAFRIGDRVGIPWLARTCGHCAHCLRGAENLCDTPDFTGYTRDGGYAEMATADERFCVAIPPRFDDVAAAPLLCAGLIGHRAARLAGDARRLGLYGFGAAAHLAAQVAAWEGREVHAFTRPGDVARQELARRVGCAWAGGSDEDPGVALDAAIIFAPDGALVPAALARVGKAGVVVCAGIHMSDIPSFAYHLLWGERQVRSVANLTREDARRFMRVADLAALRPVVSRYALARANDALDDRGPAAWTARPCWCLREAAPGASARSPSCGS